MLSALAIDPVAVAVNDQLMNMHCRGYMPSSEEIMDIMMQTSMELETHSMGTYEMLFLHVVPDKGLPKGIPPSDIPPEPHQ